MTWQPRARSNEINDGLEATFHYPSYVIDLIDTAEMQRLRYIAQLGFVPNVFPNATHNRFAHSIGTSRKAIEMYRAAKSNSPTLIGDFEPVVAVGGLAHDLGYYATAHGLDSLFLQIIGKSHEEVSADLLTGDFSMREFYESLPRGVIPEGERKATLDVLKRIPLLPEVLGHFGINPELPAQLIDNRRAHRRRKDDLVGRNLFLREFIDGAVFDADKLDYLERDPRMTGVDEASFNAQRIIANIGAVVSENGTHLAIERDCLKDLHDLFNAKIRMYSVVFTHRTVLEHEAMVYEACKRFLRSLSDGKREKYQRSVFLLDDRQFESFLVTESGDPVATYLLKLAKLDRRGRYRTVYSLESRDLPAIVDGTETENLTILRKLRGIDGDFPEDVVRDGILTRANAGGVEPLREHEVIVYSRTLKGPRSREDHLRRFDLYVFDKRKVRNGDHGYDPRDPSGSTFYFAPEALRDDNFHDDHLDRLFDTFTRSQTSSYFVVLAPPEHRDRVAKATREYIQNDLLKN